MHANIGAAVADGEKMNPMEVEDVIVTEKYQESDHRGDYAGAVAKSDPKEFALVRKLDWRIMPMLWAMYFLYVRCFHQCFFPKCNFR